MCVCVCMYKYMCTILAAPPQSSQATVTTVLFTFVLVTQVSSICTFVLVTQVKPVPASLRILRAANPLSELIQDSLPYTTSVRPHTLAA
jgi:hypothetical protein